MRHWEKYSFPLIPQIKKNSQFICLFCAKRTRLLVLLLGRRAVKNKQLLLGQASGYCLPTAAAYFPLLQTASDVLISKAGRSGLWLLGSTCCFNFASLSFWGKKTDKIGGQCWLKTWTNYKMGKRLPWQLGLTEIESLSSPSQKRSNWQRTSVSIEQSKYNSIARLSEQKSNRRRTNHTLQQFIYCLIGSSLAINLDSIFLSCLAFLLSISYASPYSDTWQVGQHLKLAPPTHVVLQSSGRKVEVTSHLHFFISFIFKDLSSLPLINSFLFFH